VEESQVNAGAFRLELLYRMADARRLVIATLKEKGTEKIREVIGYYSQLPTGDVAITPLAVIIDVGDPGWEQMDEPPEIKSVNVGPAASREKPSAPSTIADPSMN